MENKKELEEMEFDPGKVMLAGMIMNVATVEIGKKEVKELQDKLKAMDFLFSLMSKDNFDSVLPLFKDAIDSTSDLIEEIKKDFDHVFTMDDLLEYREQFNDSDEESDEEVDETDIPCC